MILLFAGLCLFFWGWIEGQPVAIWIPIAALAYTSFRMSREG